MSSKWLFKSIVYLIVVLGCGIGAILCVEIEVPIYKVLIGATMLVSFHCGREIKIFCDEIDEEVYGDKENDKNGSR